MAQESEIAARALGFSNSGGGKTGLDAILETRTSGKFNRLVGGEYGGYGSRFDSSITTTDVLNASWDSRPMLSAKGFWVYRAPLPGKVGWIDIGKFNDRDLVSLQQINSRGWCVTVDAWGEKNPESVGVATLIVLSRNWGDPTDEEQVFVADIFPGALSPPLLGVWKNEKYIEWYEKNRMRLNRELKLSQERGKRITVATARKLGFDKVYLSEKD